MSITIRKTVIAFFILFASVANAQKPPRNFEIGAGLSAFVYQGDLTPKSLGSYETLRPGINLYGSLIMNRFLSFRTNLAIGSIKGDDAIYDEPPFRQQRNFNFRTPVIELSELIVWDLFGKNYKETGFSPYVYAGAGVSILSIKRDHSRFNAFYFSNGPDLIDRIAEDEAHSLPSVIPVIPLGGGVRYGISPKLAISLESAYRLAFTDYIDGFSIAANPEFKDHYQTITLSAVYRIAKKTAEDCPVTY